MRNKLKNVFCSFFTVAVCICMTGCGAKKEAVIMTDGEEITETQKQYETLGVSKKTKFSYDDLVVGNIKYMMTEQKVKEVLGEPVSIYNSSEKNVGDNLMLEKVYSYNDLTLIFSQINGEYKLTAAASVSDQDTFSRGLKVGDSFDKVLSTYYRDQNCMNNELYSDDKTADMGKMLYGDFTIDALENVKTANKVEYGMINYNGFDSLEVADSYMVEFTYFEPPYKGSYATINDDFAQLSIDIDKKGIITAIRWYYYPEQ